MNIRVLLFGPAATSAGAEAVVVSAPEVPTCGDVIAAVGEQFPALRPFARVGRLAVNGNYADVALRVADKDEIALISLVSGG